MMRIETKYSLGDEVLAICKDQIRYWESCAACDATGQITLRDDSKDECPRCRGNGGSNGAERLEES